MRAYNKEITVPFELATLPQPHSDKLVNKAETLLNRHQYKKNQWTNGPINAHFRSTIHVLVHSPELTLAKEHTHKSSVYFFCNAPPPITSMTLVSLYTYYSVCIILP